MNDYTNELNRCWLRIGAISKVRAFTGEELEYKYPLVNNEDAKNLQQAYEKFNSSFDDLLNAEMEYLNSLKETTEKQEQELTTTKATNEELKYLRERSTKATLSKGPLQLDPEYSHRAPKTINLNVDFTLDKDLDIDKIAEYIEEKIKESSIQI